MAKLKGIKYGLIVNFYIILAGNDEKNRRIIFLIVPYEQTKF